MPDRPQTSRRRTRFDDLPWQEKHRRLERMQGIAWALIVFSALVVYLSIAIPWALS